MNDGSNAYQADGRILDCLIVGGGPAGLTAAIYVARYRRSVAVLSEGRSRASYIPKSHNYPGFPNGISGDELIQHLNEQAGSYGVPVISSRVIRLQKRDAAFEASHSGGKLTARTILLATGLVDVAPPVDDLDKAVAAGLIRYCPVCDAFEARGRKVAILGGADAVSKAKFMRAYSKDVTVIWSDGSSPPDQVDGDGIKLLPCHTRLEICGDKVSALNRDRREDFDILYPALGCTVGSGLAVDLGAAVTDGGCLKVDDHQRTTIEGIYAAGDVVSDLHQIAVATGHAAIAATRIHRVLSPNPY